MSFIIDFFKRADKYVDFSAWANGTITSRSFNHQKKHYTFNIQVPASVIEEGKMVYFSPSNWCPPQQV